MKIVKFAAFAAACLICCNLGLAQDILDPNNSFHAGLHSGSWTLERSQLLDEESKDPYRSCRDPYCARCAKHLADYGHEYQFLAGPSQRQRWYRGTTGTVAIVTQRGYDQHGRPYAQRGNPAAAIVPWEYMHTLNHAIWEQVQARNAVAAEEAAHDRVLLLAKLLADANEQLRLTKEAWEQMEPELEPVRKPCNKVVSGNSGNVSGPHCTKTYIQFCIDMKAARYEVARQGMCAYCLAHARYQFDLAYVAEVEKELELARQDYMKKCIIATETVRVALLSKDDADKATRFKRLQYKPPKYKEVLAAMGEPAAEEEVQAGEAAEPMGWSLDE